MAMLATLLVPLAAPAMAATDNRVATVPTVSDDATNVSLGTLTFKEDSDFKDDLKVGSSFTITFPAGVKIANSANNMVYWSNDNGATYVAQTVSKSGDYTVDVTIPAVTSGVADMIQLRPIVDIDGFSGGDIEITVDGFDSGITGGKFVIGRVESGSTTASVISVEDIGDGVSKAGTIRITETSNGALGAGAQSIVLKLPTNFEWDAASYNSNLAANANISFLAGLNAINGGLVAVTDITVSGRTLTIDFTPGATTQRGIIQIQTFINATSKAKRSEERRGG